MSDKFEQLALDEAAKSLCEKRKVGAIIVDATDKIVGQGYNHYPKGFAHQKCCEDEQGETYSEVIHAEDAAIRDMNKNIATFGIDFGKLPLRMYVTHSPCKNCKKEIEETTISQVLLVENFMKFDKNKVKYSLVPSIWSKGDGIVVTKGAIKYKPENWRKVSKEEYMKYWEAAYRHMLEWRDYMEGLPDSSLFDDGKDGIGTHHLMNARVDLGFLLTLTETEEKANEYK